jgi:hypothetical protein
VVLEHYCFRPFWMQGVDEHLPSCTLGPPFDRQFEFLSIQIREYDSDSPSISAKNGLMNSNRLLKFPSFKTSAYTRRLGTEDCQRNHQGSHH